MKKIKAQIISILLTFVILFVGMFTSCVNNEDPAKKTNSTESNNSINNFTDAPTVNLRYELKNVDGAYYIVFSDYTRYTQDEKNTSDWQGLSYTPHVNYCVRADSVKELIEDIKSNSFRNIEKDAMKYWEKDETGIRIFDLDAQLYYPEIEDAEIKDYVEWQGVGYRYVFTRDDYLVDDERDGLASITPCSKEEFDRRFAKEYEDFSYLHEQRFKDNADNIGEPIKQVQVEYRNATLSYYDVSISENELTNVLQRYRYTIKDGDRTFYVDELCDPGWKWDLENSDAFPPERAESVYIYCDDGDESFIVTIDNSMENNPTIEWIKSLKLKPIE